MMEATKVRVSERAVVARRAIIAALGTLRGAIGELEGDAEGSAAFEFWLQEARERLAELEEEFEGGLLAFLEKQGGKEALPAPEPPVGTISYQRDLADESDRELVERISGKILSGACDWNIRQEEEGPVRAKWFPAGCGGGLFDVFDRAFQPCFPANPWPLALGPSFPPTSDPSTPKQP